MREYAARPLFTKALLAPIDVAEAYVLGERLAVHGQERG